MIVASENQALHPRLYNIWQLSSKLRKNALKSTTKLHLGYDDNL